MRQGILFGRSLATRPSSRMVLVIAGVVGLSLSFATFAGGCDNGRTKLSKEQEEQGMGWSKTSSTKRTIRLGQRCKLDEMVVEPIEGTPEAVIYELLDAARAGDDDKNFARFAKHFDSSKDRKFVRKEYWSKARRNVAKYIQGDSADGVSFKVCRREKQGGPDKVKLFIQSLDKGKSNPPLTLKKDEGGAWKVVSYTP